MDQLKKLREKKGHQKMRPMEQKAKMGVVQDLRDMANSAMGGKLKGLNKVTVASNDQEGLRHGLDKAKDMVSDEDHMMAKGGEVDPLATLPEAYDDSHPDHENFLHSENEEDGDDGMSAYPDADGDHLLEMDEAKKHEQDESEEKDPSEDLSSMHEDELDQHIQNLMAEKQRRGL